MMNHIHESTTPSFSEEKKSSHHTRNMNSRVLCQICELLFPLWSTPERPPLVGCFYKEQSKQHVNLLRTPSPPSGEHMIRHLWRRDGWLKEQELFSGKKKTEERHGSSLLIGERGKEYFFSMPLPDTKRSYGFKLQQKEIYSGHWQEC